MRLLESRQSPLDSALEVRVSRAIEQRGLPRPTAGHSVFDDSKRFVMKVDFAWTEERIALHVDGYAFHQQRERFERDAKQRARLGVAKWWSISVTSRSLEDRDWSTAIQRMLQERRART